MEKDSCSQVCPIPAAAIGLSDVAPTGWGYAEEGECCFKDNL